jgi:CBS domain-containing protein
MVHELAGERLCPPATACAMVKVTQSLTEWPRLGGSGRLALPALGSYGRSEGRGMTRRDVHLDAMLRHLGAAYYESLHGRASAADVARARNAVEERLAEPPITEPAPADGQTGPASGGTHRHGHWHSRVRDVMTTRVVTVDRITGYKEIAGLLAKHHITAVPVLIMGRHVAGVVSEDDLLTTQDDARQGSKPRHLLWARQARQHRSLTAGEMMTSPAITIHPDATINTAARLMHTHQVKSLPVIGPDTALVGIVSRGDLLKVFLRPDQQIAHEVHELLTEILLTDPAAISVRVRGGVVTLAGQPASTEQHDLIPVALRLIWDIDGVVDVVDKVGTTAASR